MNPIYIPARSLTDWRRLFASEKHWKENCSAMLVAISWYEASGFPPAIARIFRKSGLLFRDLEPLLILPEHRVPLPGAARSSQTDVWILARHKTQLVSIAVEGKVGESFGPTLREWLVNASDGRRERLAYIKKCLNLRGEIPREIRYQLLHRCASAAIEASRFNAPTALMLIQSFNAVDAGFVDYRAFTALFNRRSVANRIEHLTVYDGVSVYAVWVRDPMPVPEWSAVSKKFASQAGDSNG